MNRNFKNFIILPLQLLFDAVAVYGSFYLAYHIRFKTELFHPGAWAPPMHHYFNVIPAIIVLFLMFFKWSGLYETHKIIHKTDEFLAVFKGVVAAFIMMTAATFLYRDFSYSRLMFAYAFFLNIFLVYLSHRIVRFLEKRVFFPLAETPAIILIGGKKSKKMLLKNMSKMGDYEVIYMDGIDFDHIENLCRDRNVGEIILVDIKDSRDKVIRLLTYCENNSIEFKMVPDMIELKMGEMSIDSYFGIPVLQLKHPLFEPSNYYFKRCFDIVVSMAILVFFAPFLMFIMAAIFIDSPGPIIYAQKRKGYRHRDFRFYKFRSMVVDAEKQLRGLLKYNERPGAVFKMKKDPRITRVGKFIRTFSIDEIPQFFNVLKGDMSLVGPRPQILRETRFYDEEAKRRLSILPGITGLWQVSGRSDLSYDEMIKLDLYYLENWTPGFDIKILLKTIPVVVSRRGAC